MITNENFMEKIVDGRIALSYMCDYAYNQSMSGRDEFVGVASSIGDCLDDGMPLLSYLGEYGYELEECLDYIAELEENGELPSGSIEGIIANLEFRQALLEDLDKNDTIVVSEYDGGDNFVYENYANNHSSITTYDNAVCFNSYYMVYEYEGSQIEQFEEAMDARGYGEAVKEAKEVVTDMFGLDKEEQDLER